MAAIMTQRRGGEGGGMDGGGGGGRKPVRSWRERSKKGDRWRDMDDEMQRGGLSE